MMTQPGDAQEEDSNETSEIRSGSQLRAATPEVAAPSRWKRRVVLLLLSLVGLAVWFAPTMAARYLTQNGVHVSDADGRTIRVEVQSAALGWLSTLRLNDITVTGVDGERLVMAESVVSRKTLATILFNQTQPGLFIVRQPNVTVTVRNDGNTLNDAIEVLLAKGGEGPELTDVGVTIEGGTVRAVSVKVDDSEGVRLLHVDDIQLSGHRRLAAQQSVKLELTAAVTHEGSTRPVQAAIDWSGPREGLPMMSGVGTVAFKFDPVPVALLQASLSEMLPGVTLDRGTIAGEVLIDCDLTAGQMLAATGTFVTRDINGTRINANAPSTEFGWQEESLTFDVSGQADSVGQTLTLSKVALRSSPLAINAAGTITDLSGECVVNVSGDLQYNVEPLVQSLAADYREHVRVEGLQTQQFAVRGPLANVVDGKQMWDVSRLSVAADLVWQTAEVFGVRSDRGTIVTRIEEGVLHLEPHDVSVSGGRLIAAPFVGLLDERPLAEINRGPALENVRFTPEMCRLWLKYLSPPMADAADIDGQFSISLSEGRIPLDDAASGKVVGQLDVHSATVRPGPFAKEIVNMVGSIKSLVDRKGGGLSTERVVIEMQDQRIPFAMVDGRVHHQQLRFFVAGVEVRTSGSVGFDESLDLVIEVPLSESWFKKPLLANMLRGEVIRIPVRGTLNRPQFDKRALGELGRRLALKATGGMLQKLLE